jgi:anthranilate/para-aminobenzoate synthase component I
VGEFRSGIELPNRCRASLHASDPGDAWNFFGSPDGEFIVWADAEQPAELVDQWGIKKTWQDPLDALRWMAEPIHGAGRWVGYLSYDLGRVFENFASPPVDDLGLPLFVFTHHRPSSDRAEESRSAPVGGGGGAVRSNFTRAEYESAVGRAIEYIRAGDIFQVNLSQRFSVACDIPPSEVYRRLRERSPARYGACLEYGDFALVSNSPELFLRITADGGIITRPIKGTRPRLAGMESELLNSGKDQAELNMIVDLERNDLGRICRVGSVRVTQARVIEAHPTVFHGAATIEGKLRPGVGFVDVLRAVFPGGSVTGAPKIRAMEIIDELEPVRRGPYCGAIGYIDADGSAQFNVAIRTILIKEGQAYIPVGGGIVADSEPAAEYDETLVKAKAMFDALDIE